MTFHFSIKHIVAIVLLTFSFWGCIAVASGNSVPIGLTVNTDVTSPSQPTSLSATPVSTSQIDLSWNASTDNVAVSGYVVRRDGLSVSSTSLTTFSDSGLVASTLYSYTVTAYDATLNYSTPSLVVSATTSAPSGGGGGGGDHTAPTLQSSTPTSGAVGVSLTTTISLVFSESVRAQAGSISLKKVADNTLVATISASNAVIVGNLVTVTLTQPLLESTAYYVEVSPTAFDDNSGNYFGGFSGSLILPFSTADITAPVISLVTTVPLATSTSITWNTNESALSSLSLGTTTDYGLTTANEMTPSLSHGMLLEGLIPGVHYYFRIIAKDSALNQSQSIGEFTTNTLPVVDIVPPGNVSNFTATGISGAIQLSWVNPSDIDFSAVRVLRSTVVYPLNPNDGLLVYEGAGQNFLDENITPNTVYYYTIFSRDLSLNYSSGVIHTGSYIPPVPPPATTTPPEVIPPPTPGTEPPVPPTQSGSDTTATGATPGGVSDPVLTPEIVPYATSSIPLPFTSLPPIENLSTQLRELVFSDFHFFEVGKGVRELMPLNNVIRLDGEKSLRVSIVVDMVPSVLKTLAVTIADPVDPTKATTVLLRLNPQKSAYEGTFEPFKIAGVRPLIISVLDHENRGGKLITGQVAVFLAEKAVIATSTPVAFVVEQVTTAIRNIEEPIRTLTPVTTPAGIAIGTTQAVLLVTNVQSFADIYLLLLRIISAIAGLFRRKKSEPWGVVYDSVTKRPIDPAYVIARGSDTKSKGEAITDLDGRYGFVLEPGQYIIQANKTHYKFPSAKLAGKTRDEFYDNLYFGDDFKLGKDEVVKYNIPLDPIEFDWNEYAKVQDKVFKVYSKRDHLRIVLFNLMYYVGFAFSLFSFVSNPQVLNGAICIVYLGISLFQMLWKRTHRINRVLRRGTGNPIPYSLVKVYIPGLDTAVKKTVADEIGRFYFLVPPGSYVISVEEKLPDESYREVLRTKPILLRGGVMTEDLMVG